jgi:hypothetical protein
VADAGATRHAGTADGVEQKVPTFMAVVHQAATKTNQSVFNMLICMLTAVSTTVPHVRFEAVSPVTKAPLAGGPLNLWSTLWAESGMGKSDMSTCGGCLC